MLTNTRLLQQTAKAILAHPDHHDQVSPARPQGAGTACCFATWTVAVALGLDPSTERFTLAQIRGRAQKKGYGNSLVDSANHLLTGKPRSPAVDVLYSPFLPEEPLRALLERIQTSSETDLRQWLPAVLAAWTRIVRERHVGADFGTRDITPSLIAALPQHIPLEVP